MNGTDDRRGGSGYDRRFQLISDVGWGWSLGRFLAWWLSDLQVAVARNYHGDIGFVNL